MNSIDLIKELNSLKNPEKIPIFQNFFKTKKGQYGEGDVFLGISVPKQRIIAKKYLNLPIKDVEKILHSKIHEHRLTALLIWTYQFEKSDDKNKTKIFDRYLRNTKWINNWDLVDLTAPKIVGKHLLNKPKERQILYELAISKNLWEKRISIVSTFAFIYQGESKDTLAISEILLNDTHDLIHKAVGWMLREVGKRVSQEKEEKFLNKHYQIMPRTMLRYAIERFDSKKNEFYMKK